MDEYGGFKTQFTSVMENVLKTAVGETTKLFERTLQQMKAELVHLRQENADLKTGVFSRQYLTSQAGNGSPRTDHAQSVSKCDTGVQCEKPIMVEKCCSPALFNERSLRLQDITNDRLVDMCSNASEDGNRQLALLLIKKEPQDTDCDEYAPGYFLLKQEGAEPILVRKEPFKDTMERVLIPSKFQTLNRCNGNPREISTTNTALSETTASSSHRVDSLSRVPQSVNTSRLREDLASHNDTKRQNASRPAKSTVPELPAYATQQAHSTVSLSTPIDPLSNKLHQMSALREEKQQTDTLDHLPTNQPSELHAQLRTLQTQQLVQNIQNPNTVTHLGPQLIPRQQKPITDPCQSVQSIQAPVATTEKAVSPPSADQEMTLLGPQCQTPFSPDHHTVAPGQVSIPLSHIPSLPNQVPIPPAQGPILPIHVPTPPAHVPVPSTQVHVQSNDILPPQSLDIPVHFPLVPPHNLAPLAQPPYPPNQIPFPPPYIPAQSMRSSVPPVSIPQTNTPCALEHIPVTSHYQILSDPLCSSPDQFFHPPDNASDLLRSLNPTPFHSAIVLTQQEAALEQPSMMHSQSTGQALQLAPLLTLKEQQAAASNQGNVPKRGPTLPVEISVPSVNNFEQNIQRFPPCSSPAINSDDTDSVIMEMHSEEDPIDNEDSLPACLPGVTEHYKVLSKPDSNFRVLDSTVEEQILTINMVRDPQIDNEVIEQKEGCDISSQLWEPTDSSGELSHSALSVPMQNRGRIFQKVSRKVLEKKTECSECGRILSNASSLENHMRLHRGERPYTCSQCGKAFPSVRGLNRHVKVHAEEKGYKCEECGRSFVYQFTLTKHKLIHSGDRPFPCKICGKKFLAKADRATHMRMHTGEKPFFCSQCGKSFKHRVALNMHMQGHRGEKRYVCPHCEKGFVDLGNFKRHKRIHTGEKPFECKECGKRFTQSAHLKKHVNTQHIVPRTK
ncbi:uncharacterized protein LOC113571495 isoform X2 [Electrophorus electricus]|uniref:uncharacterized protein LOC113571495 isoform X2 n=1 Tax=Electrophorus electricus TaxID=8005 RepID=UPI0015D0D0C2|nr:uncharacterized protein LOC113571495 isoform X2 [Electrophorus electricus]